MIKDNKKIIISILILVLIILSFYFDNLIVESIFLMKNNLLNDFFLGITFVSSGIIIFFFLTSLFLWKERKRKWILLLWFSLALSVVVSFILKILVQRQRPFQLGVVSILSFLEKANYSIWNFSFPSFQAMMVFSAIPILSKEFPKFRYIWIIFACLVAFSRVYFGLHFMSDVLIGGLIGYIIGIIVVWTETEKGFGEKIYKKVFGR